MKIKPLQMIYVLKRYLILLFGLKMKKFICLPKFPQLLQSFLLLIMPPEIKIVYDMTETTCSCGGKLHKHEIKQWKMNKRFPIYKQRYKCQSCQKNHHHTIKRPCRQILQLHQQNNGFSIKN